MTQQTEQKAGLLHRATSKIMGKKPERVKSTWNRLHEEGAFTPISNQTDTETRRIEIQSILIELQDEGKLAAKDDNAKADVVDAVYGLFFMSGSPWYRGLDNRELSKKVADFLWLYNEVRDLPAFLRDLFMCAMQLIHLSFQALDVTNTPWIIIEKNPAPSGGERIDLTKLKTEEV